MHRRRILRSLTRAAALFIVASAPVLNGCDDGGDPAPNPDEALPREDHTGDLLIDDFDDGDVTNAFGFDWDIYTDGGDGGESRLDSPTWLVEGGFQSSHKAQLEFTLAKGSLSFNPFLGLSVGVSADDAAGYAGLSYVYRGSAHVVQFLTTDVLDYDYFLFNVPASAVWKRVRIRYDQARQLGFGADVAWNAENLDGLGWQLTGADGLTGTFELDEVYFESEIEVDRGPVNLPLLPAAPPKLTELESIAVPGPLQAKAVAELNRGYNITNWLEESAFEAFEYDEAYVESLAAAGFKALRLPIDLDLYVTAQTGAGDELVLELDEQLFTILDRFETWTSTHGLSFTIDYHQYDSSLDLTDPGSVDLVVALWRSVAHHFASNPRSDLYYELMNEPELSSGASSALSPAPWTAAADRLIAAIRAEDPAHTIIFGDVNWYGVNTLTQRTPFADQNIVYAFHFYEPFIFTHQGASWANMSSTRNIPFPYTPERWSDHASDLGLTSNQPAWIWDQFRGYNVAGTREALFNSIARAKSWAVRHGVPVICNEFGAYDGSSLREDRLRYYTDVIDIFEELEIPWQHWFMVLDQDGHVPADVAEAFHLEPP